MFVINDEAFLLQVCFDPRQQTLNVGGTLSVTPINSTFTCQTHLVKKWFWWQGLHIFQQNLSKSSNICLMRKEFRFPQLYGLYCPNLDNDQSVNLTAAFTVFWQLCGLTFECHFLAFKYQLWVDFWPLVLVNDCFPVIGRCVKVAAGLEYLCQKGSNSSSNLRQNRFRIISIGRFQKAWQEFLFVLGVVLVISTPREIKIVRRSGAAHENQTKQHFSCNPCQL